MPNQWFRFYSEWLDDEKVQMMPVDMQRHLVALFCLRCTRPTEGMTDTQIAFRLRVDETFLKRCKECFITQGFVDEDWCVLNWGKRQFTSDSSTDRVRKFRENKGQKQDETFLKRYETVSVTAPEQNRTDTEQKQIQKKQAAVAFILPSWIPQQDWDDFEEMRKKQKKPMTDRARRGIVAKLDRIRSASDPSSVTQILEQSIRNDYQDVYELRSIFNGNGQHSQPRRLKATL